MKKFTFILFALITGTTFGQDNSASATASADIVSPITITNKSDLVFGKVIPDASAATTVVLNTDGTIAGTSTATTVSTSKHSAASFEISATKNYTYSITVPAEVTLKGGGTEMKVELNSSMPTSGNKSTDKAATLNIGGTLNVNAAQAQGNYTGTFNVTVAYE